MSDPRRSDLHAWLSAHAASELEPDERNQTRRMLDLLESERPFSRDQFGPGHFTASAFVLAPTGGALLLIHHARLNRWLQPGGHVDAIDADVLAAARRELGEEVGLGDAALERPGIFDVDVHAIPAGRGEPAHEHFDVRFLFRAPRSEVVISDEAHDARWVSFSALDPASADASVMRVVRKLQRCSRV
jgi:8-oxo-dGTP pyrophosphatase MutT (NUDIX family)